MNFEEMLFSVISKFLNLNSILNQQVCNVIIYCDSLKEEGEISLQVRKGVINFPRSLSFDMPPNSKIIELQDDEKVIEFISKIEYDRKRSTQRGLIDFSKIPFYPRHQNLKIRYNRTIDIRELNSIVKVSIIKGEETKVIVENKSDAKIMRYKVAARLRLPFLLRDILDFDEKKLEAFKREFTERKLKVYDEEKKEIVKPSLDYIYLKDGICLEGEVTWISNLNSKETKIFKVSINS